MEVVSFVTWIGIGNPSAGRWKGFDAYSTRLTSAGGSVKINLSDSIKNSSAGRGYPVVGKGIGGGLICISRPIYFTYSLPGVNFIDGTFDFKVGIAPFPGRGPMFNPSGEITEMIYFLAEEKNQNLFN